MLLWGCSPKVKKPPVTTGKETGQEVKNIPDAAPAEKFTTARIALLIPFKLNQSDLSRATKSQLEQVDMALDFYQGFIKGIDSAAVSGLNFDLRVLDTRDDGQYLTNLLEKNELINNNLIVGPVFPEGIKKMTPFSIRHDMPVVSPLAASRPNEFNNPKLISVIPHIGIHSRKIAEHIGSRYNSSNGIVVIINTKKPEDEDFASGIRETLKEKYPSLPVQEYSSVNIFETKMVKGKKYAVVICSADQPFVNAGIDKLAKIAKLRAAEYEFQLFGHPAWIKQNYNIEQLQSLHAVISTSYLVDYKDARVIAFIKNYRAVYNSEPGEYAFKGFDAGYYFGKLIAKHGKNYLDFLLKDKYKGLHNSFSFAYDPDYGYYNKDLMLLQYKNLMLSPIN